MSSAYVLDDVYAKVVLLTVYVILKRHEVQLRSGSTLSSACFKISQLDHELHLGISP